MLSLSFLKVKEKAWILAFFSGLEMRRGSCRVARLQAWPQDAAVGLDHGHAGALLLSAEQLLATALGPPCMDGCLICSGDMLTLVIALALIKSTDRC